MSAARTHGPGESQGTPLSADLTVDSLLREAAGTDSGHEQTFSSTRWGLGRCLGRGGFGAVYEAVDRGNGGAVALKILRRSSAELIYRFKREFRGLAEVRHTNLVRLYELEAVGNEVFFTMERIDGASPLVHIAKRPDVAREVVAQLAAGLNALHAAGKLHRDVKPSNILVEPSGRVVLLDFGLALELDAHESDHAGTPHYMAPEQCAGMPLHEAADWYAVGVVLFEALTGRRPFEGTGAEVVRSKQVFDAPRVQTLAPSVPDDLDALCAALLARDPTLRPRGTELLQRLCASHGATPAPTSARVRTDVLVGRDQELLQLRTLFATAQSGRSTVVLARGPSGIGKSALLRGCLAELRANHPTAWILVGRCYEWESVPYKALDAVIDELARRLATLPAEARAALIADRESSALGTLFPALRSVLGLPAAHVSKGAHVDAPIIRAAGFAELRALFGRLATMVPIVICLDDLQWGDVDSANLLVELLAGSDAPPIFWLASWREDELATSAMLRRFVQLRRERLADANLHDLHLSGLPPESAFVLATALLDENQGDGARAMRIAMESGGSPLFVHELARAGEGGATHALDALVVSRVEQLHPAARRVLELVAVAAQPLERDAVAAIAGLDANTLRTTLDHLRAERLVRARDADNERLLESYHDRIRTAVVSTLTPALLRGLHLELAQTIAAFDANDAGRIGRHLADGGEPTRARGYLVRAAADAAAALAFVDAAQLYERVRELPATGDDAEDVAIELAYAAVLADAGHGPKAARVWLAILDRVAPAQRNELRRRASEELLISGNLDEGYAAVDGLLRDLDLSLPSSSVTAVARGVLGRARLALFGRSLRTEHVATDRELERVDTLGSLTFATALLDPMIAFALQTQHLRVAFESGDPQRAALALVLEAPIASQRGKPRGRDSAQILAEARALGARIADETKQQQLDTAFDTSEGIVALMEGRWREGIAHFDRAERGIGGALVGHSSMRGTICSMRMMNLYWIGRAGDMLAELPTQQRDMEARNNFYGWLWLTLLESWAHSCGGRVGLARELSAAAVARIPSRGFRLQRWYAEFGNVKFLLLEGRADEAWTRLEEALRRTRFALLGQPQRASGAWVRANAALLRARTNPSARTAMLREAKRMVARLVDEKSPWIDAIVTTLRASIASVEGDDATALAELERAEPQLVAHDLEAVLAMTRAARARLVGGARGVALQAEADAWLVPQGVCASVARVLLPGRWCDAT